MSFRLRLKLVDSQGQVSHLNAKSFLPTQKVAATNLPADRGGGGKLIKVISEEPAFGLKRNSPDESVLKAHFISGSWMYMEWLNCGMKLKCLIYTPCLIDSDLCRALFGKEAGGWVEANWDVERACERERERGQTRGWTGNKERPDGYQKQECWRGEVMQRAVWDNSSFALLKVRRDCKASDIMTRQRNMTYLLGDRKWGEDRERDVRRWDQRRQVEIKWQDYRRWE